MNKPSSEDESGRNIFEWIDEGGYECRDSNDPEARKQYDEFLRRRNYPIPPVHEEELLAELQLFGEVRLYEAKPDNWMCEVFASNFDEELYTSAFLTEGPFRTKLTAMSSCWMEINRSDIVRAYRFLEEHRCKRNPSPAL